MRPLRRRGGRHPIISPIASRPVATAASSAVRRDSMIDGDLRKLLIAQIGNEFSAHALYMGISVYFDRQSLRGWGKFFRDQAIEEAQHAPEDHGLPDRQRGRVRPAGREGRVDALQVGARRRRAGARSPSGRSPPSSTRWPARAPAAGDHRSHQFLQWFIEEQVEEEAKLQSVARPHRQRHQPVPGGGPARPLRVDPAGALTATAALGTLRARMRPTFYFRCPA